MSLYECPRCEKQIATNATTAGVFQVPPNLFCVHGDDAVKMGLVSEADLVEEAMVDE